ncbi:MAG TPA: folylpolyglutamate synthase/dihydrofolate synthase family protein [Armatimonadota bacterium]|jgi:dihydrofolate synthase/folylpolyglutamate synthase
MQALCERLDHPERSFKSVHVAGTNGKGSTTAMIAAILAHSGYRVGSYFSPYVFNVRERVMLADPNQLPRMISEEAFSRILTDLKPHVDAVAADETLGQPTEFEVKTMLAFLYFREMAVDWAVLEVGLGGRLDATNVVQPEVCVITNIGLDHTERLGNTLEAIAGEKAGIIKRGAAVVTAAVEPALGVIRQAYEDKGGAEWGRIIPGDDANDGWPTYYHCILESNGKAQGVDALFTPALPGPAQQANATLAALATLALQMRGEAIPDDAIDAGLQSACLPGRFQIIRENPTVILDGAHNSEAAAALMSALLDRYPGRDLALVIGMMGRHAVDGVMHELAPYAAKIIATQPTNDRHLPAEAVVAEAARYGLDAPIVIPPMDALRTALTDAKEQDIIVVTGSFYLVGDIDVEIPAKG